MPLKRATSNGALLVRETHRLGCRPARAQPKAYADPNANVGLDRPIDHLETAGDHIMVDPAESAHELVAAVTNNRVEGTQI